MQQQVRAAVHEYAPDIRSTAQVRFSKKSSNYAVVKDASKTVSEHFQKYLEVFVFHFLVFIWCWTLKPSASIRICDSGFFHFATILFSQTEIKLVYSIPPIRLYLLSLKYLVDISKYLDCLSLIYWFIKQIRDNNSGPMLKSRELIGKVLIGFCWIDKAQS